MPARASAISSRRTGLRVWLSRAFRILRASLSKTNRNGRRLPLPAVASFALSTSKDDEAHLELNLFQGEDSQVVGNEYVGTVSIDGLPKGPKGTVQVVINVKLDAECVLHVEARELRTRAVFKATLATRYTPEQIRSRLGIAVNPAAAQGSRARELEKRGGRFWGFLKRTFGKSAA